ncbi:NAD(P)H-dependent glycerol-3-phosphate dehydrogenase [Uliginosibacterium sp. H1]|uniref:NAD(P)H-dependent glycerol-3-phosphate dehydrogenase n=1 Tax=Uliginosibacterium sp. H1 TaxID=3114757 RepID=UPI002E174526|nr:NAD(P)H-dependent glycerol-3-phosphate dehydrogenase [Uliginosibacterium sp. H1]
MAHIAVLGAGAWGTALALTYAPQHAVSLWSHESDHIADMAGSRRNERYLPGFEFPASISLHDDIAKACAGAELALVVTPVAGLRPTLRRLAGLAACPPVLWACKGFEADSALLPHEVADAELPAGVPYGVLTGPSFADEVARGLPGAITLAANDLDFARHWVQALHHPRLRLYANDDVVGAEIGGAVKNVLAIAAGITDGLGYGHNARAALVTRGLAEIARLAEALGGRRETLMGLAGMGDLILTCTGDLSRNRRVGLMLAQGLALPQILEQLGHVAEGVLTCRVVVQRADSLGVDMPITRAVAAVLDGRISPRDVVENLMTRDPKVER